eukprot:104918_1
MAVMSVFLQNNYTNKRVIFTFVSIAIHIFDFAYSPSGKPTKKERQDQKTGDNQLYNWKNVLIFWMIMISSYLYYMHILSTMSIYEINSALSNTEIFGTIVTFLGFSLRSWSKYVLKEYFTYTLSIRENHKLIQKIPYSIIRHPGYTGMIVTRLGECFYFSIVLQYIVLVALTRGIIKRIGNEEKMLRNKFTKQHKEYCESVRYKLIPYIY